MQLGYVLPWWARWSVFVVAGGALFALGYAQGAREAGEEHVAYLNAQAARTTVIAARQKEVVVKTEIKYRDRIQTVYVKGEEIEKQVPALVSPVDDLRPGVSVGFVRSYNAAWSGEPAGSPSSTDRDSAGVSHAEVAETDAFNATACRAWRELALGIKEFYQQQQGALK
jgi:hypothetical protein